MTRKTIALMISMYVSLHAMGAGFAQTTSLANTPNQSLNQSSWIDPDPLADCLEACSGQSPDCILQCFDEFGPDVVTDFADRNQANEFLFAEDFIVSLYDDIAIAGIVLREESTTFLRDVKPWLYDSEKWISPITVSHNNFRWDIPEQHMRKNLIVPHSLDKTYLLVLTECEFDDNDWSECAAPELFQVTAEGTVEVVENPERINCFRQCGIAVQDDPCYRACIQEFPDPEDIVDEDDNRDNDVPSEGDDTEITPSPIEDNTTEDDTHDPYWCCPPDTCCDCLGQDQCLENQDSVN